MEFNTPTYVKVFLLILGAAILYVLGVFNPLVDFYQKNNLLVLLAVILIFAAYIQWFLRRQKPIAFRDAKFVIDAFQKTALGEASPIPLNPAMIDWSEMHVVYRPDGLVVVQGPFNAWREDYSVWTAMFDSTKAEVSDVDTNLVCMEHRLLTPKEIEKISAVAKPAAEAELAQKIKENMLTKALEELG